MAHSGGGPGPRKFSEKIARIQRETMRDNAEFNELMSDVTRITHGQPQQLPSTSHENYQPQQQQQLLNPPTQHWNRCTGSLPNVYDLANQPGLLPMMADGTGGFIIPGMGAVGPGSWSNTQPLVVDRPGGGRMSIHGGHHMPTGRGRSPGAPGGGHSPTSSYFHPYHTPQTRGRSPPAGSSPHEAHQQISPGSSFPRYGHGHMMSNQTSFPVGYPVISTALLQPPDTQWSRKARSDPTIHTNAYRQPGNHSPGSAGSSPHSPNEYSPPQQTSPVGATFPMDPLDGLSGGGQQQQQLSGAGNSPGSSFYLPQQQQPNPCDPGNSGGSVPGSLPNLPSQHRPSPTVAYPEGYQPFDQGGGQQQQQHSVIGPRHSIQGMPNAYNLAATPPSYHGGDPSSSAPCSPAEQGNESPSGHEMHNQMQNLQLGREWQPNQWQQQQQYYSNPMQPSVCSQQQYQSGGNDYANGMSGVSSPSGAIPNIVLTGTDGGQQHAVGVGDNSAMETFAEAIGPLDPDELQQLLADSNVDPATEFQLRHEGDEPLR